MATRTKRGAGPLRVLQSFQRPRPTTNPYIVQLLRWLSHEAAVQTFSWRTAFFGRYDVFHIHWPEVIFTKSNRLRSRAALLLFAALLVRMRITGVAIVRTAHNLAPHEGSDALTAWVLRLCDRWTSLWIRLNPETASPNGAPIRTILHGHYRDWFADATVSEQVPGRLLFFGAVRPYKGIDSLIAAFRAVADRDVSLRIIGKPNTSEMAAAVVALAEPVNDRIGMRLEFIQDDVLVTEVTAAELVVLPYQEMHNSGALLLALSLRCPVLVPSNSITEALALEVGSDWVLTFPGQLTAEHLVDALTRVRRIDTTGSPDLSARDWDRVAHLHVAAYREAIVSRGGIRNTHGPTPRRASHGRG